MKKKTVSDLISALFVLIFFYSALNKLADLSGFRNELSTAPLLQKATGILTWGIPILELGITALILWPRTRIAGFYAVLGASIPFAIYLGYLILERLPYQAWIGSQQLTKVQSLMAIILLSGIALLGLRIYKKLRKPPSEEIQPIVFT